MAKQSIKEEQYPIEAICRVMNLPRSSYYYKAEKVEEGEAVAAIKKIALEFPTYGSRRISHQIRREPCQMVMNRKKVQRIMRETGLLVKQKRKSINTTDSNHEYPRYANQIKGLVVDHPDQVWVSDITYVGLETGFVYLAVVMDLFTRSIRGWSLSKHIDHYLTKDALKMALKNGKPAIHHSDQGVQYAAHEYVDCLQYEKIAISMSRSGCPQENGYAERVIRTIKEEEVYLAEYQSFQDAREQIGYFIERVYQQKRIHSSLGYVTPEEFELQWKSVHSHHEIPLSK